MINDDMACMRNYVSRQSGQAFAMLVCRSINLVCPADSRRCMIHTYEFAPDARFGFVSIFSTGIISSGNMSLSSLPMSSFTG